jgi:voltage-gated sodium channel
MVKGGYGAARGQQFKVKVREGIPLREGPAASAKRTGETLKKDEIFTIEDIATDSKTLQGDPVEVHWSDRPIDQHCFLELSDGRGWAMDRHLISHEPFVELHEPSRGSMGSLRYHLRQFFGSSLYEYTIMFVICVNAVAIGVEIDHEHYFPWWVWMIINTTFGAIYLIEMVLKIFAFAPRRYFGSKWNLFDFVVTIATLIGDGLVVWQLATGASTSSKKGGFTAVVPVLRLLRILRIAKMFHEMRVLLGSFVGSISALGWIVLLMALWFYICACVCTVFMGRKQWLPDSTNPKAGELRKSFDNIPISMYTLFEVMTLEGWTDVVRPLLGTRPVMIVFFMFFVFVTAFFLLNLVTAVVVDRTMSSQAQAEDTSTFVKEDERETQIGNLHSALSRRNGGQDRIRRKDLVTWSREPFVRQYLEKLDWDATVISEMGVLLDDDNSGTVSLARLREYWASYGQPLDTALLLRFQLQLAQRLDHQECLCLTILDALQEVSGKRFRLPPNAGNRDRSFLASPV